jgi:hypothetical protein
MTDLETVELAARRALVKTNDASIKVALKLLADEIASIICERAQPRRHLATPWGFIAALICRPVIMSASLAQCPRRPQGSFHYGFRLGPVPAVKGARKPGKWASSGFPAMAWRPEPGRSRTAGAAPRSPVGSPLARYFGPCLPFPAGPRAPGTPKRFFADASPAVPKFNRWEARHARNAGYMGISYIAIRLKSITFPPGRLSRGTMPLATGSPTAAKTIGIVRVSRWTAAVAGLLFVEDYVGLQADQLLRERSYPIDVCAVPPKVDPHVAANGPT